MFCFREKKRQAQRLHWQLQVSRGLLIFVYRLNNFSYFIKTLNILAKVVKTIRSGGGMVGGFVRLLYDIWKYRGFTYLRVKCYLQ